MHAPRWFRHAIWWMLAGPLALGGGCGCNETPDAPPTAVLSAVTESSATRVAATRPTATQAAETPPVVVQEPLSPCRPGIERRPGEWATFTALDGRQLRYEIVEVAPDAIVTRVEVFQDGRPLGLPATRRDPCASDVIPPPTNNAPVDRRVTASHCGAAGRDWPAFCYEDRWTDEEIAYVRRTWISDEAPLFGIVRMELHGDGELEARLELTDWGPRP